VIYARDVSKVSFTNVIWKIRQCPMIAAPRVCGRKFPGASKKSHDRQGDELPELPSAYFWQPIGEIKSSDALPSVLGARKLGTY